MRSVKLKASLLATLSVGWSLGWSVGPSPLNVFHYYASTIGRIGTKIGVRIDIDSGKKCLEDQGQGVKGQGQIHDFIQM